MATYNDFLRQHAAEKPRIRRLYWVFGEENLFKDLVVKQIAELWGATGFNTVSLSAAETSESEIWASLNQHPIDTEQRRLIVVTDAQRLTRLDRLTSWLKDNQTVRAAMATAIFVSSDAEWEEDEYREVIMKSSSASWIRCTLPKDPDDRLKRAQEILCAWGDIDVTSAGVLAQRVNFDMVEARAVMDKVSLFPSAQVSPQIIEMLAPRRVEDDIIWSIIGLKHRKAVEAIEEGTGSYSLSAILGTLATHVEMLARINTILTVTQNAKEAAGRLGAKEQYIRRLYPYARMYPRREALRRTQLLHRMDAAAQRGATEGILESLVALW